jgi:hypothetical protein
MYWIAFRDRVPNRSSLLRNINRSAMAASKFSDMTLNALKAELRQRGLAVSGNKATLIKRLEEAETSQPPEPAEPAVETGAVQHALDAPAVAQPPQSSAQEPEVNAPNTEMHATQQPSSEPEDPTEKRIARFGQTVLKDDEKAQRREERFKTVDPIADSKRVESRAARFGILTESALKEKEVARAKRFNMDTPELMEQKKKARESRFAAPAPAGPKESHTVNEIAAMIHRRS